MKQSAVVMGDTNNTGGDKWKDKLLFVNSMVYGQNGDNSKRRQVKTATQKWRQKWLYSKPRQTQTTPAVLVKSI